MTLTADPNDAIAAPGADQVVDETGLPRRLAIGQDVHRVEFDDGNVLAAPADHLWLTTHFTNLATPYDRRRGARRATSWVSTAEIARTLKTSMGTNAHFVSVGPPGLAAPVDLPIHPYVLGVWLGDGDHIHGSITSHMDDCSELARHLRQCGETVRVRPYPMSDRAHRDTRFVIISKDHSRCPFGHLRPLGTGNSCRECGRIRDSHRYNGVQRAWPERTNVSFAARLEAVGRLRNKHIPETYFYASLDQRLALLQGVMDTDGTVNRSQGSAVMTLHSEVLSRGLHRLIQSVGHKVAFREVAWTSRALKSSGTCYRMSWSAKDPVFRLARKRDLQRTQFDPNGDGRSASPFRRYITGCAPI